MSTDRIEIDPRYLLTETWEEIARATGVAEAIAGALDRRRRPLVDCPRASHEPPPPSIPNSGWFDVMCVLPDGQRGYFDGRCLWTSTGTTIHSREDADDHGANLRRDYGDKARFYVVDAAGGEYDPICTIDGAPVARTTCAECGFADVFDGPLCPSCESQREDDEGDATPPTPTAAAPR